MTVLPAGMCTVAGSHMAAREAILRQWPQDRSRESVVRREVALLLLEDPDCRLRMHHVEEIVRGRLPDLLTARSQLGPLLSDAATARFLKLEYVGDDSSGGEQDEVMPFTMLRLNIQEMVKMSVDLAKAKNAAASEAAEEEADTAEVEMEKSILGKVEVREYEDRKGRSAVPILPTYAVLPTNTPLPLMPNSAGSAPEVRSAVPLGAGANLPCFPCSIFEDPSAPSSCTNASELDFPFGDEELFKLPNRVPASEGAVAAVEKGTAEDQTVHEGLPFNRPQASHVSAPIECQPRQPDKSSPGKMQETFSPLLDDVVPAPRGGASPGDSSEGGGVVCRPLTKVAPVAANTSRVISKMATSKVDPTVPEEGFDLKPSSLQHPAASGGVLYLSDMVLRFGLEPSSAQGLLHPPPRFGSVPGSEGSTWPNHVVSQPACTVDPCMAGKANKDACFEETPMPHRLGGNSASGNTADASRPSRKSTDSCQSACSAVDGADKAMDLQFDRSLEAIIAFDTMGAEAKPTAPVPTGRKESSSCGGARDESYPVQSKSLPINDWSSPSLRAVMASMAMVQQQQQQANTKGLFSAMGGVSQGGCPTASLAVMMQQQQSMKPGQGGMNPAQAQQLLQQQTIAQQLMAASSPQALSAGNFDQFGGPPTARVAAASFIAAMASLAATQQNTPNMGGMLQSSQFMPSSWPPPPQGFLPTIPASVNMLSQFSPVVINEIVALVCQVPGLKIEDFDDGVLFQLCSKRSEEEAVASLRSFVGSSLGNMQHKSAYLRHGIKNFWLHNGQNGHASMQHNSPSGVSRPSCNGLSAPAQAALQKLPPRVHQRLGDLIGCSPYIDWKHFDAGVIKVMTQLSEICEADMLEELEMLDSADLSNVEYMPAYLNKRMNNRLWNRRKALSSVPA